MNVDGAVFKSLGCCRVGVVIRKMSMKIPFPLRATEVEAKALEEGI